MEPVAGNMGAVPPEGVFDLDGNILDDTPYGINSAGYVIHSAIHAARSDVQCVMHTHTEDGMALCKVELLHEGEPHHGLSASELPPDEAPSVPSVAVPSAPSVSPSVSTPPVAVPPSSASIGCAREW